MKDTQMPKTLKIISTLVVLILIGELVSRFVLGLGTNHVYIEDPDYEYIYAPSQDAKRFGNRLLTNKYSMRSAPLGKNEKRILIFGDSVLNGGSLTGHDDLATTHLEKELQKECNSNYRVLNISAGSWGPDNAFAYLKKHGDFNASTIVMFFSSHDAHDNMNHEKIVDIHPSFPSHQPCCALWDGFSRYALPKIKALFKTPDKKKFSKIHKIDTSEKFNTGWNDFFQYANKNNMKLIIVLHPDKKELKEGRYNLNGQEIIKFAKKNNIPYYLEIDDVKSEYYRDDIHYNLNGQLFLYNELLEILNKNICQNKK